MSLQERERALSSLRGPSGREAAVGIEDGRSSDDDGVAQFDLDASRPFSCRSHDLPVDPGIVAAWRASGQGGFYERTTRQRFEQRSRICPKPTGDCGAEAVLHRRYACNERHPGLCLTVHSDIYAIALDFAT